MDILISIKPKYVKKILSGEKKYELRKLIPKKNVNKYWIYSSSPEKRIVGYFYSDFIVEKEIDELWECVKDNACIEKNAFDKYFYSKPKGFAIKINKVIKLKHPLNPKDYICDFRAPQSFFYLDGDVFDEKFCNLV